jgi:hypothetical protein
MVSEKESVKRNPPFAPLTLILLDVSGTGDKRRRSDLDLFVLALIDSGLTTPYQLQQGAGLSPGATIPALRRLMQSDLVVQDKPGSRGRMEYKIAEAGRRRLKSGCKGLIDDGPSGDLDADLRVALLVCWAGGDRRRAANYLRRSVNRTLETKPAVDEPDNSHALPPLAFWYRRLRSVSAKALAKGESAAALRMAKSLPKRFSAWRKGTPTTTNP